MNKLFVLTAFILSAFILVGCEQTNKDQYENCGVLVDRLGVSTVETIKNSTRVYVAQLKPDYAALIPEKISERVLTTEEAKALKNLLLNQNHYLLDFKKKAVFIPQLGFRFEGQEDVWVVVSFNARQVNFIKANHGVNLDYDRMTSSFDHFSKQLIGDIND